MKFITLDMVQDNLTVYLVYPLDSSSTNHTLKTNQIELSWGSQGFYLRMVEFLEYQNLFWNPNLHICHQYLFPEIKEKRKSLCKIKGRKSTCLPMHLFIAQCANSHLHNLKQKNNYKLTLNIQALLYILVRKVWLSLLKSINIKD